MNRREWMQAGLGTAGLMLANGRALGGQPPDDSDPAPLLARMGPLMEKIAIETTELAPDCT